MKFKNVLPTLWLILLIEMMLMAKTTVAQNIGIGTNTPEYKLDVNGRMRLRSAQGSTAGIWLDGINNSGIGFIGTNNNNTIGMFGSVSGWQFVMNTDNGNIGIGTVSPTTKLDVNGNLRMRGSSPGNGAKMVSQDASGNTTWQKNYAFRVTGLVDFEDINRAANSNAKMSFHYVPVYNIGLAYNGPASIFTAPVSGIYTFSAYMESYPNNAFVSSIGLELMQTRSNTASVLAQSNHGVLITGDVNTYKPYTTIQLHGDFKLEAGDQIWIRVNTGSSHKFFGAADQCAFSGHLVSQIF